MTKALKFLAALLIAFPICAQAQRAYSQPELDQMLAPVALYPDALLSQVLMAATYPLGVVAAAQWSRANPGLQGDDAVRAVQNEDWDPSVKSLVAFPQILARMDENPGWTQSLGDAFLLQEPQVMDTVQQLRRRAQAAGNLQSSEQMYVQQQGRAIVLQPASPQYVYVPYYDPLVVYGPWWWPAYRPIAWAPWPGYVRPYRPAFAAHRIVTVAPHRWQPEPRRHAEQRVASRPVRVQVQPAMRVQAQPQVRVQHETRPHPQVRLEQRARMPEAVAPQQPRAERQERRETRREQRQERGQKG